MSSGDSPLGTIKHRLRRTGETYAEHTLETTKAAVQGLKNTHAAYLYPLEVFLPSYFRLLQGIYYFATHPGLVQPYFSAALTSLILAACIVVATCVFGYLPQVFQSGIEILTVDCYINNISWTSCILSSCCSGGCRELDLCQVIHRIVPGQRHDRRGSF